MDEETFQQWKNKPWKTEFKSALQRELERMTPMLNRDQLTKLTGIVSQVPKRPDPWGIIERIHARMTSNDSTDTLNESMLNLSTSASITGAINQPAVEPEVQPEVNPFPETEPLAQVESASINQTVTSDFASNNQAAMSECSLENTEPEVVQARPEPLPGSKTHLQPWGRFMKQIPATQKKQWPKYFDITKLEYNPMLTMTVTDCDSAKKYRFLSLNSVQGRHQIQLLCQAPGCSCILTVKCDLKELVTEDSMNKPPRLKNKQKLCDVDNWSIITMTFGHTGDCSSNESTSQEDTSVRRTARRTIKSEFNFTQHIKQEPMYF